ncbi:MAG: ABC transporter permease [Acetatifactor muris]|nr:ABC transporter permease [Acetatifactor muris]
MKMYQMLLKATWKKQKGSICGIFLLVSVLSLCLFSSLTLYVSGRNSVEAEMERLGFGNLTVWVSGGRDGLAEEIENVPDVDKVTCQPLIFAGYEVNGGYSDNEGQLIAYDGSVPYRFITAEGKELSVPEIAQGTVYISPAMRSSFDVETGDTIQFELSRKEGIVSLTVAGYFADGFMGSSMIDMKSFLINKEDYAAMQEVVSTAAEVDVLGREGAMLHISQSPESSLPALDFHQAVQDESDISLYTEFTYRQESILNYMLLLQNILSGFLIAFSVVLFIVCIIVTGHSLSAVVEQDKKDMAVLKTLGMPGKGIRNVYLLLYGGVILAGLILGLASAEWIAARLARGLVSSTGMLIAAKLPFLLSSLLLMMLVLLFAVFLILRTERILAVAPMETIRGTAGGKRVQTAIHRRFLEWDIAMRELHYGKKNYIALFLIAVFLTIFLAVIGRMGTWLGPNGEGLMNAFSVADHDLGVQPFNRDVPMDEIERVIEWYSPIQETYELAMVSVTVNGQEYEANVLNDTDWFHILRGSVCDGDSILVTDTVANELQLSIGDTVRVSANGQIGNYRVSGIYQCANGMGSNIGMSMGGYSKIGDITGYIWCYHYILENGNMRDYAMNYLQEHYHGIDVHTNSWSGLDGIVLMMHALIVVIYLIAAVFIMVSVALISGKLLQAETGNMAVYKSLGLSTARLRLSFSLRFLAVVMAGTVAGILLSAVFADGMIGRMFRPFGIGDFHSGFSMMSTLLPFTAIPVLFFLFAWAFSARLKQVSIVTLITENDD